MLDLDKCWAVVEARDATADGRFYYGVKTNRGVYCRPGCPSRRPLRANTVFFETIAAAEAAGLRACKRCRPTDASERKRALLNASGQQQRQGTMKQLEAAAADRAAVADWAALAAALDERGYATLPLVSAEQCAALTKLYDDDDMFRRQIVMQRHGYGSGEYKYFRYPLPEIVAGLRHALYPRLAVIAECWRQRLGEPGHLPPTLDEYLRECHRAGQERPTPLMLKYGPGDYNRLHQDLYGPLVFPLQLTVLLSDPQRDFTGGEFLLVEQRPRMQSRGEVVPLRQGEAVIFPVHHRPVMGTRGALRVTMRHGVSRIHSGERHTLGIIFHDAA